MDIQLIGCFKEKEKNCQTDICRERPLVHSKTQKCDKPFRFPKYECLFCLALAF